MDDYIILLQFYYWPQNKKIKIKYEIGLNKIIIYMK